MQALELQASTYLPTAREGLRYVHAGYLGSYIILIILYYIQIICLGDK